MVWASSTLQKWLTKNRLYRLSSSSDVWNSLYKTCFNFFFITLFISTMRFSMFSIVLIKNVSLSLYPDMNAEHAFCGWVFGNKDNLLIFLYYWAVKAKIQILFISNYLFPVIEPRCQWPSVDILMLKSLKIYFALALYISIAMRNLRLIYILFFPSSSRNDHFKLFYKYLTGSFRCIKIIFEKYIKCFVC